MEFQLKILQAYHGDSILIQGDFDGQPRNILIDGGSNEAYQNRRRRAGALQVSLQSIKDSGQKIDLLVLSHIDDDHIGGLLAGFKQGGGGLLEEITEKVWFNSGKLIFECFDKGIDETKLLDFEESCIETDADNLTSIRQGVKFEHYLSKLEVWDYKIIQAEQEHELFGIKFTILSPNKEKLEKLLIKWGDEQPDSLTSAVSNDYDKSFDDLLLNDIFKEDKSCHNGSSIAFIFEYEGRCLLLLGDAHNDIVIESLKKMGFSEENPLLLDYVKLSHHGSQYNTSPQFLKLISCQNFIISTNGQRHGLPNKLTLARIINQFPKATLLFNYPDLIERVFSADELVSLRRNGVTIKGCEQAFTL